MSGPGKKPTPPQAKTDGARGSGDTADNTEDIENTENITTDGYGGETADPTFDKDENDSDIGESG
jgi:hypothetical protein